LHRFTTLQKTQKSSQFAHAIETFGPAKMSKALRVLCKPPRQAGSAVQNGTFLLTGVEVDTSVAAGFVEQG
jgi:hypothetical protein